MRGVLLLLVCALAGATPRAGENRLHLAELELEGPLASVQLELTGAGNTHLVAELMAGERRTVRVPVGARFSAALGPPETWPAPQLSSTGAGTARFVGWLTDGQAALGARVPAALWARARPPIPGGGRQLSPAALLLVLGSLAVGLGLARRPLLLAGATLLLCGGLALLPLGGGAATATALEGDLAGGEWLAVRVGAGELELVDRAEPGSRRLEVEPSGARLDFELDLFGSDWLARSEGATLWVLEPAPAAAPGDRPTRESNGWGELTEVWVRDPEGIWSRRGPWARGAVLPEPLEGGSGPPGWLAAGLPQGVGVLVAREASGGRWLRLSGF